MKKMWKNLMMTVLAICLCVSCMGIAPAYAEEADTLNTTMDYLVNECGPRLYGTPNEVKAAAYVKAQFESFGYTDVEWAKPALNSTSYVGKLSFSDGIADIYGNCYPNDPDNGAFDKIEAPLVNVGADGAVVVPAGAAGDIIAAAAIEGKPSATIVSGLLEQIAAANPDVTVKGLLLAQKDSIKVASPASADREAMNTLAIPCVVTTQYFLDKAIAQADKLTGMERYTRTETNAVIATKPAATEAPDAIIIVTAHLDSVIAAPGASDNATGVSACVELAKKFSTVDNGNIELRFAAVGAEEGGGMLGSMYIINNLTAEEKAIAINLNMDMLGAIQPAYGDAPLNAVSMDIYCGRGATAKALTLNLPAFLVTDGAANITWAEGIENVRIYKYGSSDHQKFQEAGIDAASMIVVTDEDDDIETINHSSADTIENNYSYERLQMCTNLIANGIQKAIDNQLTKKAEILFLKDSELWIAQLTNAEQLFKLYEQVDVTLTEIVAPAAEDEEAVEPATVTLTFTADVPAMALDLDLAAYEITDVTATGTGIADNKNAERNEELKTFQTKLVPDAASMTVEELVEMLIDMLDEIPAAEKKEAVVVLRELYSALTEEQQAQVGNYDKLVAAEKAVEAYDVEVMIDALDKAADADKKEAVAAARAAYDKLDAEQKAMVSNYSKLLAAEKALKAPATGETFNATWCIALMTISMLAAAALVLQTKKQKA